jgi:aminoglycoside phosphotransferase
MNVPLAFLATHGRRLGLEELGIRLPLTSLVLTPRFQASRHVVFLLFARGADQPVLVAKIPRLLDGHPSLDREAAGLRAVQGLRREGFDSVPRLVAFESWAGYPLLIETALAGTPLSSDVVRADVDGCCTMVLEWLESLHVASAIPHDGSWFDAIVERPLARFEALFPLANDERDMVARTREALARLPMSRLPYVCEHGDLSHPNILVRRPRSLGVVDWELASRHGMPLYDLFVFLTYVAFSRHRVGNNVDHMEAFQDAFFGQEAWAGPYVRRHAERVGVPLDVLPALFLLAWSRYTCTLLDRVAESGGREATHVDASTASWLRTNRYFRLWQHTLAHLGDTLRS